MASLITTPGYYVDVGAYDGVEHSNTLALERLGWSGVCIEPQAGAFERLAANRKAACVQCAVSDKDGAVLFDGDHIVAVHGSLVACNTLASVLDMVDAPHVIDYLSVDTEGSDLEVLLSVNLDEYFVKLITVEHNTYLVGPRRKQEIFEHLATHGFERVHDDVVAPGYGPYEDWFMNSALRDS